MSVHLLVIQFLLHFLSLIAVNRDGMIIIMPYDGNISGKLIVVPELDILWR